MASNMTRESGSTWLDPNQADSDNPPWTKEMLERAKWGRKLRLYRLENHLTSEALANRTGFTVGQITAWERGQSSLTSDQFEQLCALASETPSKLQRS